MGECCLGYRHIWGLFSVHCVIISLRCNVWWFDVCEISGRRALLLSRSRERSSEVMGGSLHLSRPTVRRKPLTVLTIQSMCFLPLKKHSITSAAFYGSLFPTRAIKNLTIQTFFPYNWEFIYPSSGFISSNSDFISYNSEFITHNSGFFIYKLWSINFQLQTSKIKCIIPWWKQASFTVGFALTLWWHQYQNVHLCTYTKHYSTLVFLVK